MWQQVYDPLHSTVLSALVAAAPIILFLLSLTVFKLSSLLVQVRTELSSDSCQL